MEENTTDGANLARNRARRGRCLHFLHDFDCSCPQPAATPMTAATAATTATSTGTGTGAGAAGNPPRQIFLPAWSVSQVNFKRKVSNVKGETQKKVNPDKPARNSEQVGKTIACKTTFRLKYKVSSLAHIHKATIFYFSHSDSNSV